MKKAKMRNVYLLFSFILIIVVGALIILAARHLNHGNLAHTRAVDDQSPVAVPFIITKDHIFYGTTTAPIQVIIYSDLECPYCKHLYESTILRIEASYKNSIVVAFRHDPLPSRPRALPEAYAAECVSMIGGESAFRSFIDHVYRITPSDDRLDPALLPTLAAGTGIDVTRFNTCMKNGDSVQRVHSQIFQASIAGLNITPSIVLKSATRSYIVKGDYYGQIAGAIDYLLKN